MKMANANYIETHLAVFILVPTPTDHCRVLITDVTGLGGQALIGLVRDVLGRCR